MSVTSPSGVIKRDRYGRYRIRHPHTGKEQSWTRATTFAKSISEGSALAAWKAKMAVKGVAATPGLLALASATPLEDRGTWKDITEGGITAAGGDEGRNLGSALHSFTEAVDRGEEPVIPDQWQPDVLAYRSAMRAAGLRIAPEYIECVVVNTRFNVAGTFDRLLRWGPGSLIVGDLKTAKDVSYGWLEIAVQLALYASAEFIYDPVTDTFIEMPPVDPCEAIVMHLPVGRGKCDLYTVDIASGLEIAELCRQVRGWRTASKKLAKPYVAPARFPDAETYAERERRESTSVVPGARGELLVEIRLAATVPDLELLWAKHPDIWTSEHTEAARRRKAELCAPPF